MNTKLRLIMVVWLTVAVILGVVSFLGGDASIVGGWLFLIWTAPFGVIWWFYLYDYTLAWMPAHIAQPIGTVAVIIIAFLFWFILIPRIRKQK
jgi:drug/metabolite transporter (DMT)-like permease